MSSKRKSMANENQGLSTIKEANGKEINSNIGKKKSDNDTLESSGLYDAYESITNFIQNFL